MSTATDLQQRTRGSERSAAPRQSSPRGWRRLLHSWQVRHVLVPFVVTRVALMLIGWLALQSFQNLPASPSAWEIKPNGQLGAVSPNGRTAVLSVEVHPLVNMWSRWDAAWYHAIAKYGYEFRSGRESNAAFFPLYPMLMRAVHAIVPGDSDLSWFVAGILVSNAALLIALYYLALLVRLDSDGEDAGRAVLYLLVFPTSLFLSAVYAESLFLAATVAAFYYARRDRWLIASLCAAAATLTRTPGILLIVPLSLEYLLQRGFRWRDIRFNAASLLMIPAALGGLMFYFHLRFGNAMATRDAQASWGHGWGELAWPWQPFVRFAQHATVTNEIINVTFASLVLVLIGLAILKLRASYSVYAALAFWFVSAWGSFDSMPRYVLPIFPAFIALALLGRNQLFDRVYVAVASSFAAFFMVRFALWRWVA